MGLRRHEGSIVFISVHSSDASAPCSCYGPPISLSQRRSGGAAPAHPWYGEAACSLICDPSNAVGHNCGKILLLSQRWKCNTWAEHEAGVSRTAHQHNDLTSSLMRTESSKGIRTSFCDHILQQFTWSSTLYSFHEQLSTLKKADAL